MLDLNREQSKQRCQSSRISVVPLWVSRTTDGNTVLQSSSPFFFFNILAGLHANHSKQWDTVPEQAMAQRPREQVPSYSRGANAGGAVVAVQSAGSAPLIAVT